ncbi:MAG: GntR family transcriptional regulator [Anaerolineae bacterium]|nr:GntR family transcriptional regulator [Anaerolineae bacterium]
MTYSKKWSNIGIYWYTKLNKLGGLMHLDKQHPRPVYLQLKELLQNQIEHGVYVSHQKLPSERDLCQHYDLSRMTARRALQGLIADGLAYTRVGKGTFVSHRSKSVKKEVATQPNIDDAQIKKDGLIHSRLGQKLLNALNTFNCIDADQTISEILAKHSLETVAVRLFPELINFSEKKWASGSINLLTHNYVIVTIRSQLIAMMNAATMAKRGPMALLACAPEDLHEIGLISLALSLRRRGLSIIYLGPMTTANDFQHAVEVAKPQVICVSAATDQGVENLYQLGQQYFVLPRHDLRSKKQIFTFGGVAFTRNPALASKMPGLFLGHTIEQAITNVEALI